MSYCVRECVSTAVLAWGFGPDPCHVLQGCAQCGQLGQAFPGGRAGEGRGERRGRDSPRLHAGRGVGGQVKWAVPTSPLHPPPLGDVPSCASEAVLVVAEAGLVCCRPTIGQERHSVGRGQTVRRRGLVECLLTYLYFCPLSH